MDSRKISSHQKLKKENTELQRLYERAMRRLGELGEGVEVDDHLTGMEEFKKSGKTMVKVNGWTITYKHKETDRITLKEDSE